LEKLRRSPPPSDRIRSGDLVATSLSIMSSIHSARVTWKKPPPRVKVVHNGICTPKNVTACVRQSRSEPHRGCTRTDNVATAASGVARTERDAARSTVRLCVYDLERGEKLHAFIY